MECIHRMGHQNADAQDNESSCDSRTHASPPLRSIKLSASRVFTLKPIRQTNIECRRRDVIEPQRHGGNKRNAIREDGPFRKKWISRGGGTAPSGFRNSVRSTLGSTTSSLNYSQIRRPISPKTNSMRGPHGAVASSPTASMPSGLAVERPSGHPVSHKKQRPRKPRPKST
jgi:hypothetical protein